jgi:hypothetical protein
VLDRHRGIRKFRRITGLALTELLPAGEPVETVAPADDTAAEPGPDEAPST